MERLTVSGNRRFIVTESGRPFFWLADTAWELFYRLTPDETAFYLENRRQKGFNVVLAVALPELGMAEPARNGYRPLEENDPARPVEGYWAHVDNVIRMALYIGLLPTWGDKVNLRWGAGPVIFDVPKARAYGAWIARRYRDVPHLIWVLGGDRDVVTDDRDYAPVWRAMAAGIREHSTALMTFHLQGWRTSASMFHHDAWLDVNMWQSGHMATDLPIWNWVSSDYERVPPKPVLDGEPNYEDHPINPFTRPWLPEYGRFDAYDVRKQAYRAVFSGACGHTYGHHSVWQFYSSGQTPVNFPELDWKTALDRPGAGQMIHLRGLLESRPMLTRVPASEIVATGQGADGGLIRVTRCSEGRYVLAYITQASHAFSLHLSDFRPLSAAWMNPRTGQSHPADIRQEGATLHFTTPSTGSDWVLVMDGQTA